ncbi:MAG: hypothetical protein HY690_09125 [Chloroflexi bacterium]|nr:hypothetical protein [Chloroflexota bacterium]
MARQYRRQKLAREPRQVRGWRTVKAGSHRVTVALLHGGGTRATSVRHPKGEPRKNVDIFTDELGRRHPIRDSYGYREWQTGSSKGQAQRAALRQQLRARRGPTRFRNPQRTRARRRRTSPKGSRR